MGRKRSVRVRVNGVQKKDVDTRRLARAIINMAASQSLDAAQDLADELEDAEKTRRSTLHRARTEAHTADREAS